ncbi:hypothetical protein [Idiomarina sp. OT37-5b]|uniref:hypothetical protein n=1 Tax=Idiomarina sp. OT37-5b TaxID=2100422 RepID=UPI001319CF7E|nr:hypothetical protein [Idiomarina sp. OT37-5b]
MLKESVYIAGLTIDCTAIEFCRFTAPNRRVSRALSFSIGGLMSNKKFAVDFDMPADIHPCYVYVGPSKGYSGYQAVVILYVSSRIGKFDSPEGIAMSFDVESNLFKSEQEAIDWAEGWIINKSKTSITLREVDKT